MKASALAKLNELQIPYDTIPESLTYLLQPLDVGVMGPFKRTAYAAIERFRPELPAITAVQRRQYIVALVEDVVARISSAAIARGWRESGLYRAMATRPSDQPLCDFEPVTLKIGSHAIKNSEYLLPKVVAASAPLPMSIAHPPSNVHPLPVDAIDRLIDHVRMHALEASKEYRIRTGTSCYAQQNCELLARFNPGRKLIGDDIPVVELAHPPNDDDEWLPTTASTVPPPSEAEIRVTYKDRPSKRLKTSSADTTAASSSPDSSVTTTKPSISTTDATLTVRPKSTTSTPRPSRKRKAPTHLTTDYKL